MVTTRLLLLLVTIQSLAAQDNFKEVLGYYNKGNIPYIKVDELTNIKAPVIVLDAREKSEYEVSHLPNAVYVGYDDFDLKSTLGLLKDKTQTIVVYCSIGVRSEDVASQLKSQGYIRVFNLYGGIFEWVNQKQIVYNSQNQVTKEVHAYSEAWSKWLIRGVKVYD